MGSDVREKVEAADPLPVPGLTELKNWKRTLEIAHVALGTQCALLHSGAWGPKPSSRYWSSQRTQPPIAIQPWQMNKAKSRDHDK